MHAEVMAVIFAAIGGMTAFGLLVVCGQALVRRLRLVGDPPDELAFEPAPPLPVDPDPATAPTAGSRQRKLLALHRLTYDAQRCADESRAVLTLATSEERDAWEKLVDRTEIAAATCRRLVDQAPDGEERLTTAHAEARAAHAELEGLVGERCRPTLGRRILLAALVLLLLASLALGAALVYGPLES